MLQLYLDVNGLKGRNQLGRDTFRFFVTDDGVVYPGGGQQSLNITGESSAYLSCDTTSTSSIGCDCAKRILETGKMDY